MKYEILLIIGIALIAAILGFAFIKDLRHALIVPEGYAGLLYHNTMVLGVPGFVPLKNGKVRSRATNTEESGAS